jgi:hypothetical protein
VANASTVTRSAKERVVGSIVGGGGEVEVKEGGKGGGHSEMS